MAAYGFLSIILKLNLVLLNFKLIDNQFNDPNFSLPIIKITIFEDKDIIVSFPFN